jgi:hypothetical protein
MSRGKTGVWVDCEYCGKKIYKTQSQFNKHKHHYCSNKCQSDLKHKETYEDRACEICGQLMHVSKKSTQRFCSDKCQNKWQSQQVGFLNKKCTKQCTNCDFCGKEFLIKKYKLNDGSSHFCSKECRQKWYSTVWSQSENWKEESRKRQASILKDYSVVTLTKPQVIINDILNNMNINFINEKDFVYYSVDNYLKDYDLIIEVMGDYWHASPIKYKQLNDLQKKNVRRDKAKHSFLLDNYHIEVLYLWEKDIINNLMLCRNIINTYINNDGKMDNYHSFNYELVDDQLLLKSNIIIPYQDMEIQELKNHIKVAI